MFVSDSCVVSVWQYGLHAGAGGFLVLSIWFPVSPCGLKFLVFRVSGIAY